MKYKPLGTSSIQVSEIGFGCMSLEVQSTNNGSLIRSAFENGINFFDTADLYDKGINEQIVGKALKPIRKEVIIATKVGNEWRSDGSGWDWNPSKEYILKAVDDSLRRLQTDYIDLYQLHGGTIEDPIDETIEAFELLKEQGKIREYGISSIRPNVLKEWSRKSSVSSIMMQYSLLDRRPEEYCFTTLAERNISVISRGVFAKGLLIDKPPKDYLQHHQKDVETYLHRLKHLGNPIELALGFVLNEPVCASAMIGFRTKSQLEQLLSVYSQKKTLIPMDELRNIFPSSNYLNHR